MQPHVPDCEDIDRRLARDPIAIVGLAGKFPKAGDIREFWDNIMSARDCSDVVPESWWKTAEHYDPNPFAEDRTYCRRGGFLTPEVFDPLEFGMPPNTVDSTGLVQLLGLVVAKELLRDAGLGRDGWYDPAGTGVVLGVCGTNSTLIPLASRLYLPQTVEAMVAVGVPRDTAEAAVRTRLAALPPWTEDSFPGILGNIVSGRIANRLNLGAANHTVDAACASSLTAVRSAVDELVSRRADLMLTGGCDADNSLVSFMCFSKTPALSPTGQVRPFAAEADGTLVGEGIGMLALKRLGDAQRHGDRIYAVLRGLGSSSDGNAQSIYAPCGAGQLRALRRAYDDADCAPGSVELIEAHGTGTLAGDAVELTALNELLADPEDHHYAAVGSVKSQIGHTKAAAGAAGLIKAALALHHKVLPPTINVDTPHPQAAREDSALYVNTAARPWVRDPARTVRRAGVSAFGFGGVNYHAVLEEYAPDGTQRPEHVPAGAESLEQVPAGAESPRYALHTAPRACLWHAADADALRRLLEDGAAPHEGPVPPAHARVGFVSTGPRDHAELLALAAARLRDASGRESWSHPRGIHYRDGALPPGIGVGALFAGQGSQYVQMGLHAALALPPVRAAFDEANARFPAGDSLARTVFPPPGGGDPAAHGERLRRTAYAQSAIGALSMGQYRYLRELGFAPHGMLGHSFGELSALWAAGALDDEAFTTLARARGQAMEQPVGQDRDPGAMAAVRMPRTALDDALAEHTELTVCNRNAPDEHTVGGPTPAVRNFVDWCASHDLPARRLPVAAAFHTPRVHHAAQAFSAACAAAEFTAPALPVYADTAGAAYGADAAANRRTLVQQLCEPVDFAARVEEMYADGIRVFVEFGPGRVLTQLVERFLGERGAHTVSCDAGAGTDSCAALKQAAVQLAVLGLPLSLADRYAPPPRPERPEPSRVARALEGPFFALENLRPGHEKLLAETASATARALEREKEEQERDRAAAVPVPVPAPAAAVRAEGGDPLSRAAADHLAAHTRYLDSQIRTAEQLTGLLREGSSRGPLDESLVAAVNTVTEHSLALGEAHARAGEVVSGLLRLPGDGPAPWQGDVSGAGTAVAASTSVVPLFPQRNGPPSAESGTQVFSVPESSAAQGVPAAPKSALAELWAAGQDGGTAAQQPMNDGVLDPEELERVFRTVVAEKTGYDVDMIEPDMYIQTDLGIDSLKQVEIGAELMRRYPAIARSEMYRFSEAGTVRELMELILATLAENGPQLLPASLGAPAGRTFVTLRDLPPVDVCTDAYARQPRALLFDDGGELPGTLAAALSDRGWHVSRLTLPGAAPDAHAGGAGLRLTDWDEDTLATRLAELLTDEPRLDLCVLPASRGTDGGAEKAVARLRHAILVAKHTVPLLRTAAGSGARAGLVSVTRLDGSLGYGGAGADPVAALAGGLGGLVKAVGLEAPTLFCRAMDFAPDLAAETVGEAFAAEIADLATDVREVGVDAAGRRAPELSSTPAPHAPAPEGPTDLTADDLLLVTGGAGGITAWCVEALAREHPCGYLLLGRTPLEDEPAWATGLGSAEELHAALEAQARRAGEDPGEPSVRTRVERHARRLVQQRSIRSTLAALRSHGAAAEYVAADVRDARSVAAALAPYAARVTGVLHGAGVLGDRPLAETTAESVAAVVDTKLAGLSHVLAALDTERLRHLVLFSSVAGIWGNLRQADYAVANEGLNRFGCAFQAAHPRCRVLPLAWGPWAGGMATAVQQLFTDAGVPVLSREEGCEYFLAQMAQGKEASGVVVVGPTGPLYHRLDRLPPTGRTAYRSLTGIGAEPVLRDHCFGGVPVLPMTAAVGWALNAVERAHGGSRPVVGCRDFRIAHGIFLVSGHAESYRVRLAPENDQGPAVTRVAVHEAGERGRLCYEGRFQQAEAAPEAPRVELPPYMPGDTPHPSYGTGRLFHGPALRGLRNVLLEEPGRLVVAARLPDPGLAKGAYAGGLYAPAAADLLLQTGALALLSQAESGDIPVPVTAARVELFAPLPDDEGFVIVADARGDGGPAQVFGEFTVTACAPDGRVLQRWSDVRTLWMDPATVTRNVAEEAGSNGLGQG
ncbi:beta-ketoacyl synthase N-terminal-like domain-containing protein [Streptomyces sp. NPDC050610]|uniref:beta-ketoacyl synthase N-terminal-like domain-containing protein n=1 Tax=Streptomyces sp. NPDC050610 TaxID=3157097 RepID=UPI00342428DF